MKNKFLSFVLLLFLFSCKKETVSFRSPDYLQTVRKALKDSVAWVDYNSLDFDKAVLSKVDSVSLYYLRIPFIDSNLSGDFVVVRTDATGKVEQGKIVHLQPTVGGEGADATKRTQWNGSISLSSLNRNTVFESPIIDGYITAYHQGTPYRTATQVVEGLMPEIIITYVISSGSNFSWSFWMNLQSYFYDGSGSVGTYYGSMDGSGSAGGGGSGGSSGGANGYVLPGGGGPEVEEPIQIDFEAQGEKDAIDIEKFINCFNSIPDAGATCTIEIMADIPVDSDPNKIFDFSSKSPGHSFLNIRKKNGTQSVSQNIGFYPKNGWKNILTNAPIESKFVDNGNHEFNAGFVQSITPEQLQHVLVMMQRDKNMKYAIDNFNCTDWALDVFNAAGAFQLDVPHFDIPGNYPSSGTRMPSSIYLALRNIKATNPAQAPNVDMDFLKAYAGNSTGPCN